MSQEKSERLSELYGPNAGYVLELYDRYKHNPRLVDKATKAFFDDFEAPPSESSANLPTVALHKIVGVTNLAQAIRDYGHLAAHLDPLDSDPPGDPSLELATHGLKEDDLRQLPASLIGGPLSEGADSALKVIASLRSVYSSTTGHDYRHIRVSQERLWLRQAVESRQFQFLENASEEKELLDRLTGVEIFERFLHRAFPGKFRFSLEGLDMLVPMLDEIISKSSKAGIRKALLGMGHRGRLNVLANVLNKKIEEILAEFKDPLSGRNFGDDLGWTGDVKYHLGATREVWNGMPADFTVILAPNPSHLEAINPVVEGMARAASSDVDQAGAVHFDPALNLPILIHGDAAFTGQGIVAETLNLSRLPGYDTGGTIHIIANNQLGFTTNPGSTRSTHYASDLAKGFEIPVIHVNADDPAACIEAARMAFAYRSEFRKDFLIDFIGYRRRGHNEADEAAFTQPLMNSQIREHPTVREKWAKSLVSRNIVRADFAEELISQHNDVLQRSLDSLDAEKSLSEPIPGPPPPGAARHVRTSVTQKRISGLGEALWRVPNDFSLHPKIRQAMERRKQALEQESATVDWSTAEDLAFGSILEDGIAIRLTGEDTERGTFSQRHSVLHDTETEERFIPLESLPQAKAAFEVRNSPLSENAVLGFEYGYCIQKREQLVIWEAQYGDFINGAQVIVDEFLVSGRAKWGQLPSLVLLLPHGFEGQGPNHSSAHLERLLQLAVDENIRIASCSTAAQYFHLLRRQALLLRVDPLPLVVLTPKSLIRHPRVTSPLRDLVEGGWRQVIDDAFAKDKPGDVQRLILCHGKISADLLSNEKRETSPHIAIIRIEQLYPYPSAELESLLVKYPQVKGIYWVQEEPENMGAWQYLQPRLQEQFKGRWPLSYVGRPSSASPAEGSGARHAITQKAILEQAYGLETTLSNGDAALARK